MNQYSLQQRSLAEFFSTFCLVLLGCGAMVVNAKTHELTHVGVASVWGLVVMIMIYAVGRVSGAHMNPAVTIAFVSLGKMNPLDAGAYIFAQCFGAIAASLSISAVLGNEVGFVGATTSSVPMGSALLIEFMMTAILMFVVMGISTGAKEESVTAGVAVGATIGIEAMVAGPLTKASMNPARSLGPALVAASESGAQQQLWIYFVAPIAGAIAGGYLHRLIHTDRVDGAGENSDGEG